MDIRCVIQISFLCWIFNAAPCFAVIIVEKGVAEPIRGYLVETDEARVVVDVLLPNGETRQRILPRSSIEEMIQAVSQERLESLSSERPQDYRDYAEELAGKTNDPDAQRTAIRLYQIAAYLAPDKLGRSCLLGMVSLARTPDEERKFRAVAFLLDAEHDRSVMRAPKAGKATDGSKLTDEQRQQLRVVLRALREGRGNDARTAARKPGLQEPLRHIATLLTPADFADLGQGETLPPGLMFKVLAAELAIDPQKTEATDEVAPRRPSGWSHVINTKAFRPVPVLSLEMLTEFDPRECHFRNGKWAL